MRWGHLADTGRKEEADGEKLVFGITVSLTVFPVVALLFLWWLVTGRGPGGRLV